MDKKLVLYGYKVGFALLVIAAVATQVTYNVNQEIFNLINFFSFFTIESNILAAALFVASAVAASQYPTAADRRKLDYLRGAATLYMLITGLIYSVLLANADVQTALPWVNAVLHYIFPIVVLLDWIIDRPSKAISGKNGLWWLLFPLVYALYSLVRGHFVGWYPYPFLNVDTRGYAAVLATGIVIAAVMVPMALFIAWLSRFNRNSAPANSARQKKSAKIKI